MGGKISSDIGLKKLEEEKGLPKTKVLTKDSIIMDDDNEVSVDDELRKGMGIGMEN